MCPTLHSSLLLSIYWLRWKCKVNGVTLHSTCISPFFFSRCCFVHCFTWPHLVSILAFPLVFLFFFSVIPVLALLWLRPPFFFFLSSWTDAAAHQLSFQVLISRFWPSSLDFVLYTPFFWTFMYVFSFSFPHYVTFFFCFVAVVIHSAFFNYWDLCNAKQNTEQ